MIPLAELLPHAPPMVLLDDYESPIREDTVVASVTVKPSSPFFEPALGGVPATAALEYMAQTMAVLVGLTRRRQQLPPQVGFVLGSRRLETRIGCFKLGERYRITVTCTYNDESFGSFDCEIVAESGQSVARGTLTAYQPAQEITPEGLKQYE